MKMLIAELEANSVAPSVTESPKTWNPVVVAGALRKVVNGLFDPYRPELHYMRGGRTSGAKSLAARRLPRVDAVSRAEPNLGPDPGRGAVGLHSWRQPLRRGRLPVSALYPLMRVRLGGSPKALV